MWSTGGSQPRDEGGRKEFEVDGDGGGRMGRREGDKEQEEKSGEQCETRGRGEEKSSWARSTKRSTLLFEGARGLSGALDAGERRGG